MGARAVPDGPVRPCLAVFARNGYDEENILNPDPIRFMRRLLLLSLGVLAAGTAGIAACSSDESSGFLDSADDAAVRRDAPVIEPLDGGSPDAALPPSGSCAKYCSLVQSTCTGANAQYTSEAECLAFCSIIPLGEEGDDGKNTVACRQHYADSPARSDAFTFCAGAGPFGGGFCEDRCTVFCQLAVEVCSPDAGRAPFPSYADCRTACSSFKLLDSSTDGGDGLEGPREGDSLNCRLFQLRQIVMTGEDCTDLGVDSGACR